MPTEYPSTLPDPRRGYLLPAHVAALFATVDRERNPDAPAISTETVLDAVRKSKPGGRYASRPLRAPTGYVGLEPGQVPGFRERVGVPYWAPGPRETLAKVEAELMEWRRGMVGQGVGGGPKRKPRTDRAAGGA
ncbi:hypothetical protein [Micromonospora chersina]|uniref:hypothetical protein n=1 Tax=Micromonospora chersina TaxID=47854 RepID=UPI0037205056